MYWENLLKRNPYANFNENQKDWSSVLSVLENIWYLSRNSRGIFTLKKKEKTLFKAVVYILSWEKQT